MASSFTSTEGVRNSGNRISNPHRLLILAPSNESHTVIPPFLLRLTGHPVIPTSSHEALSIGNELVDEIPGATSTTPPSTSFAGYTTHAPLQINTKYYNIDVPIWVDEIPSSLSTEPLTEPSLSSSVRQQQDPVDSLETWKNEFLSAEAEEVREAIGAIIVCVQRPIPPDPTLCKDNAVHGGIEIFSVAFREKVDKIKKIVSAARELKALIEEEKGEIGGVPGLVVLVGGDRERPSASNGDADIRAPEHGAMWWEEELDDQTMGSIVEIICWDPKEGRDVRAARNEYGELVGMPRVLEVLETHEWSSLSSDLDDALESLDLQEHEEGLSGVSLEANELESEIAGLRLAINNPNIEDVDEFGNTDNDSSKVEQLETLLLRAQAIKDIGADLPDQERKRFAAKAIKDLMKDI